MAKMDEGFINYPSFGLKLNRTTYLPSLPPSPPATAIGIKYSRSIASAPYKALAGVIVDGRIPERYPTSARCRERKQVGLTNRWRLPASLGADFLGTGQATRSIITPLNDHLLRLITAEGPHLRLNCDLTEPYRFRVVNDRVPVTTPAYRDAQLSKSREPAKSLTRPDGTPPHQTRCSCVSPTPLTRETCANARQLFVELATPQHYNKAYGKPDVILECLGMKWGLHKAILSGSAPLAELYAQAKMAADPKMAADAKMPADSKNQSGYDSTAPDIVTIKIDIDDPLVTPNAFAVALSKLYLCGLKFPENVNLAGVLVAAHLLKVVTWTSVEELCKEVMISSVGIGPTCCYYEAAVKTGADDLAEQCVAWLQLNLVSQWSDKLQLRHLPLELVYRVISSPRLFTFDEYALYKLLVSWLFLQLNPNVNTLQGYNTITTYFHSLSKTCAYLESEEGQSYVGLFRQLHLHGLTDSTHVYNVQLMNIIPPQWMLKVLAAHYHSLQAGGDMSTNISFEREAIRYGFIIDKGDDDYSKKISMFGFHFELKSVKRDDCSYDFYIQRLKPSDPILSVHDNERQTFSLRPDRAMHYSIQVQYQDSEVGVQRRSTGKLSHKFGLGFKTGTSKIVNMTDLQTPFFVSFAIMLPPS